jgi:MarR family
VTPNDERRPRRGAVHDPGEEVTDDSTRGGGRPGQFALIPDAAADYDGPALDFRILIAIGAKCSRDRHAWISQQVLAERFGVSHQTVARAIKRLTRAGLLVIDGRVVTDASIGRWVTRYYVPRDLPVVHDREEPRTTDSTPPDLPVVHDREGPWTSRAVQSGPDVHIEGPDVHIKGPVVQQREGPWTDSDPWFRPSIQTPLYAKGNSEDPNGQPKPKHSDEDEQQDEPEPEQSLALFNYPRPRGGRRTA